MIIVLLNTIIVDFTWMKFNLRSPYTKSAGVKIMKKVISVSWYLETNNKEIT